MARKNPVPAREREICRRLREARKESRLSQVAVAAELGIDSSLLASYEHGRVPIRYGLAAHFCSAVNVNQRWLATGAAPMFPYVPVGFTVDASIKPAVLFSVAYDEVISPIIERKFTELEGLFGAENVRQGRLTGSEEDWALLEGPLPVHKVVEARMLFLPPGLRIEYAREIMAAHKRFHDCYQIELESLRDAKEKADKLQKGLTALAASVNMPLVNTQLDKLLARLKRLTRERGAKSELAEFIGAPLASVSRWLSGERVPDGPNTLRLLQWVERQERK